MKSASLRGIVIALAILLSFFAINNFAHADIQCPSGGTQSPNHPGCCYTGASAGGMCVVNGCETSEGISSCPSLSDKFGSGEKLPGIIEGSLAIDSTQNIRAIEIKEATFWARIGAWFRNIFQPTRSRIIQTNIRIDRNPVDSKDIPSDTKPRPTPTKPADDKGVQGNEAVQLRF